MPTDLEDPRDNALNELDRCITAAAAYLEQVDRRARDRKDRPHWDECWLEHTRCLAARLRAALTGEDTDRG